MSASAILFHLPAAQSPTVQARPAASSPSDASTNTISANDFLTLLVTEMKNQDPTNSTDPNQYINQLVSVNSLEQLIQINQTLSGALSFGSSTSGQASPAQPSPSGSTPQLDATPPVTFGNLAVPAVNPSALQVARALSPHPRA